MKKMPKKQFLQTFFVAYKLTQTKSILHNSRNYHQTLTLLNACFSRFGREFFSFFSHAEQNINSFPLEKYKMFFLRKRNTHPIKKTHSRRADKHIKHTYSHRELNVHKGNISRFFCNNKLFNEILIRKLGGNFIRRRLKGYNLIVLHNFTSLPKLNKIIRTLIKLHRKIISDYISV